MRVLSVLFHAVSTSSSPKGWNRNVRERISQLNKKLVFIKVTRAAKISMYLFKPGSPPNTWRSLIDCVRFGDLAGNW